MHGCPCRLRGLGNIGICKIGTTICKIGIGIRLLIG